MGSSLSIVGCIFITLAMVACSCGEDGGDTGSPEPEMNLEPMDITGLDYTGDIVLEDRVTTPGAVDYYATDELRVEAMLTIRPGVVIEFESTAGILISSGTLVVQGSETARVVMRERTADTGWLGVSIFSVTAQSIANLTLQDAGRAVFLNEAEAAALSFGQATNPVTGTISGLVVEDSRGVGFYAGAGSSFTATSMSVSGSAAEGIFVGDFDQLGMFDAETTVTGSGESPVFCSDYDGTDDDVSIVMDGIPIHLDTDLLVTENTTLQLAAGTQLLFNEDAKLSVAGTLQVQGSASAPVTLGARNNTAGGWGGIWIYSGSANTITHATITQGGGDTFDFISQAANIVIGDGVLATGKLTISNSTVSHSAGWGIHVQQVAMPSDFAATDMTYDSNASGDVNNP